MRPEKRLIRPGETFSSDEDVELEPVRENPHPPPEAEQNEPWGGENDGDD